MAEQNQNPRLGTVGGQAVLEGLMMKSRKTYSVALRMPDDSIKVITSPVTSVRTKYKILNLPIIRGFVNMIETLILSYKTLMLSTETFGLDEEEEEETKFEKWLNEKFGKSLYDVIMVIATILGFALGFGIFFVLPALISGWTNDLCGGSLPKPVESVIEGVIKIGIFILYLWAVSNMKDIRRTFEYHGAEHKTIFCYESGEELTVENVKKFQRFHPRCGTSFIFVLLLIGIFFSILLKLIPGISSIRILYIALKILILPIVVGVGFEFIMYAGKHDNACVRIFSAPGLWMQRLTTREPDGKQIEVAIKALKTALPEVFPEEIVTEEPEKPEEKTEGKEEPLPENTDGETPHSHG